jgi:hypothetical protein
MDNVQFVTVGNLDYMFGKLSGTTTWYIATNTPTGTNQHPVTPPTSGAQNSTNPTGCAALPSHGHKPWRVPILAELARDNNLLNSLGFWTKVSLSTTDWVPCAESTSTTQCRYWTRAGASGGMNKTSTNPFFFCVRDRW